MNQDENESFQVSVKGLFFNKENKILLIQEAVGIWEAPGGRVQEGEDIFDALKRECLEEAGLPCEILDTRPLIVYSAIDHFDRSRLMLFYKVKFEHLNFVKSDECVDMKFFNKEEMKDLKLGPTMKFLPKHL
jgi:8-oxo-dGTP diphosphatase